MLRVESMPGKFKTPRGGGLSSVDKAQGREVRDENSKITGVLGFREE